MNAGGKMFSNTPEKEDVHSGKDPEGRQGLSGLEACVEFQ